MHPITIENLTYNNNNNNNKEIPHFPFPSLFLTLCEKVVDAVVTPAEAVVGDVWRSLLGMSRRSGKCPAASYDWRVAWFIEDFN